MYYDIHGKPMKFKDWSTAWMLDQDRRIAENTLPDGKWVSTVWLGIDHRFDDGPPLIFETMVFPKAGEWGGLDYERYSTLEEAKKGHQLMIEKWTKSKV